MIKSIVAFCVFAALSCAFAYSDDAFSLLSEASLSDSEKRNAERSPNRFLPYLAGSGEYFVLNPITDPILIGSGIGLFAVDLNLHRLKNDRRFDGSLYNRDDVSAFDRWAMRPYSRALDITGDVFIGCTMATPLVFASVDKHEWITIGLMYAETMLLTHVVKDLIKSLTFRPRPYMYFDGYPQKYVDSGDWNNSFPSGHTMQAFAAASFTSFVFAMYFPGSLWNIPVSAGSYALAATVAVLRLSSGNHFLTDVLFGAAFGTVFGIGVPLLHRIGTKDSSAKKKRGASLTVLPNGFQAVVRF
ncbi:phosphatase PAP2 family protein [Treponema socranskii]|uniref:phosphatase PAP2 family protein n=1 Tax=Treponema socranskii TaxID=53419 RepID=UPI003D8CA6E5